MISCIIWLASTGIPLPAIIVTAAIRHEQYGSEEFGLDSLVVTNGCLVLFDK